MDFISLIGNDRENWGQIAALIKKGNWDKIVLIKNKSVTGFPIQDKADIVEVNSDKTLIELKKDLMSKLRTKLKDFEVFVSLASGNGKEHMALISALLSIPVGIRLVAFTKEGINFIN